MKAKGLIVTGPLAGLLALAGCVGSGGGGNANQYATACMAEVKLALPSTDTR